MNTTHHIKTNRLVAALLGVAAAAAVTPALLVAGAGTAHADDGCYGGSLQYSYYCSPASGAQGSAEPGLTYAPVQPAFGFNNLPGCSGGALAAIAGVFSGDGC